MYLTNHILLQYKRMGSTKRMERKRVQRWRIQVQPRKYHTKERKVQNDFGSERRILGI